MRNYQTIILLYHIRSPSKSRGYNSVITFFLHHLWKKYIVQNVVLSSFPVFIWSMLSRVIIIFIEFTSLGINMFWSLLEAHFNPCLVAKMNLNWVQNILIFMQVNINSTASQAFYCPNPSPPHKFQVPLVILLTSMIFPTLYRLDTVCQVKQWAAKSGSSWMSQRGPQSP